MERVRPYQEEERRPEARLVLDYIHETRGFWRDGMSARIRIYNPALDDETPIVLATELPDNENTSITNMAEVLAAEIIGAHLPQRFDYRVPVLWLEHYPPAKDQRRRLRPEKFEIDRVTFESWTPRIKYLGGIERVTLGEPTWHPLKRPDVEQLIGVENTRAVLDED